MKKKEKELYSSKLSATQLYPILLERMDEDRLREIIRDCKYIDALIKRQYEKYKHGLFYNLTRLTSVTQDSKKENQVEIVLNAHYKITYCDLEEVNTKYRYQLKTHNLILTRDNEQCRIIDEGIITLQKTAEDILERRQKLSKGVDTDDK